MSTPDELIVKLPKPCRCTSMTARLVPVLNIKAEHAADAICTECNARRLKVSEPTMRTLTKVAQMFGTPREPIVFRASKSLMEKIEQQDFYLKTHYVPDGRTMYQVITDIHNDIGSAESPTDSGETEAVD